MFKKAILVPAVLFGTALFVTTSAASAHEYEHHRGYEHYDRGHHHPIVRPIAICPPAPIVVCRQYLVVYRPNCNASWQTQGLYPSQAVASDAAAQLQAQHFEALVWLK